MNLFFALLCLLALAVAGSLARRLAPPGDGTAATAGALAFVGFPLLLLALLQLPGVDLPPELPIDLRAAQASAYLVVVALGAVSQEIARIVSGWVVLRLQHRLPSATWHGLGFGGAELLYLALGAAGQAIVPALMGAAAATAPSWGAVDLIIGTAERCAALAAHVAFSYAACASIARRSPYWFLAAAGMHAVVNLTAAALPREQGVAAAFVGVVVVGSFSALALIHRRATWLR